MSQKKINDLIIKKNQKLDEQRLINEKCVAENRSKTAQEAQKYYELGNDLNVIEDLLNRYKEEEDMNMSSKTGHIVDVTRQNNSSFRDWVKASISGETKKPFNVELRADPWISSTDTGVVGKVIAPVSVLYTPSEELLRNLGVRFYDKVQGQLILPSMPETTAVIAAESGDASSADMASSSLTLSPRRFTAQQKISLETLSQENVDLQSTILNTLVASVWNKVADDFFDNLDTDAASQIKAIKGSTLALEDLCMMEASIGRYNLTNPKYVMANETKAFCKKTAKFSYAQDAIWQENKVNEYPAFSTPSVNGEKVYFGDFSNAVIASFGPNPLTIIVDPFTYSKQGQVQFTIIGMYDSAIYNKRGFCILSDASTF